MGESLMAITVRRYVEEWGKFVDGYKNASPATHKGGQFVNNVLEACEASPYMAAHLLVLILGVAVLAVFV